MSSLSKNQEEGTPVVLGGGGMRGPALLGFLDFLDDQQVICSEYIGVSIGSVVAAFRANGKSTDYMRKVFSQELFRWNLVSWVKALVPPIFSPKRLLCGGVADTVGVMTELVEKHGLKPMKNMSAIALDLYTMEPIVMGSDWPLNIVLAASCAVPGIMRPVEFEKDGRKYMLVDGGIYHPQPGKFCDRPAIIAKLIDVPGIGTVYPDRACDFVASVGKPWSLFFTRLNDDDVDGLHRFGYAAAKQALLRFINSGDIPVATPA